MSLNVVRKVVLCMTISWVGFDSFPDHRINRLALRGSGVDGSRSHPVRKKIE